MLGRSGLGHPLKFTSYELARSGKPLQVGCGPCASCCFANLRPNNIEDIPPFALEHKHASSSLENATTKKHGRRGKKKILKYVEAIGNGHMQNSENCHRKSINLIMIKNTLMLKLVFI